MPKFDRGVFVGWVGQAPLTNPYYVEDLIHASVFQNGVATGPSFPNILPSNASGLPGGAISLTIADKNLRNPYTQQWDFAIERQLTSNLGLTVNYLGSRGVAVFTTVP